MSENETDKQIDTGRPDHGTPVNALAHPPKKHHRTMGENIFDVATYGGFTMLGNEWLSTAIIRQTEWLKDADNNKIKPKLFSKAFDYTGEQISKALKSINSNYIHEGRFNWILWACIGGFFLVPPVKLMENNKRQIVRKIDDLVHGGDSEKDPNIKARHQEMDTQARQSWRSLGEGRILVVVFAQIVDFLIGWPKAISSQFVDKHVTGTDFKSQLARDFGSYERATLTLSRYLVRPFDAKHRDAITHVLKNVSETSERYHVHEGEGKILQNTATVTSLLSLTAVLTLMFYASSKIFATGREEKLERRHEKELAKHSMTNGSQADAATPDEAPADDKVQKPTTRIASVESLSRVNTPEASIQATV